jgi:tRNA(adenine34) deaminase
MDDRHYLELALEEAERAFHEGTIPIGAVILGPSGEIISIGRNRVHTNHDATAHAEIDAIRAAGRTLFNPQYKNQCTIYSSVEPCPMCSGALILADISRSVWALSDDYLGAMRIMKDGLHFRHKYDRINITPQPYLDLAERSEKLHKEYDRSRVIENRVSNIKSGSEG